MNRQINVQNEQNEDESEDTLLDQCESCCYELQHAATYPYKCVYNDVLQEYKMRLKKARMELADKELMIALLKDQHSKMENYCRCSLEEARSIKAKYYQLAQDLENMKKEYVIQMHRPSNASNESAEAYLRSEIDTWKKENKEILDKIEMVDFDVQKLLQIVSDTTRGGSGGELEARMARLEEVIEKQSGILALLHSKVAEHSKAMIFSDILVGSKLDEIMEKTDKSREDLKDEISLLKKKQQKTVNPSIGTNGILSLESFNMAILPSTGEGSTKKTPRNSVSASINAKELFSLDQSNNSAALPSTAAETAEQRRVQELGEKPQGSFTTSIDLKKLLSLDRASILAALSTAAEEPIDEKNKMAQDSFATSVDLKKLLSLDQSFKFLPPMGEGSTDRRESQLTQDQKPSLALNPEDDVRISIQVQRASKSKDSMQSVQKTENHSETESDRNLNSLRSQETSRNASTNTEKPQQHFMDEVTSTTNTELILGDFLEIAAKEKKYFDDYGAISISEVYPPISEQLSVISEVTTGENEKLFREMPVNPIVPPKRYQNPLETFNEFQHFESARFSVGLSPSTPGAVDENDEKSMETPTMGSIPACCVIPQEESEKSIPTNDFPVVLFQGFDKKKVPLCCRASGDSGEDLRIEEISSSTQPDYSGTLPEDIMAGDQKVTTSDLSHREEHTAITFSPLGLDETSSLGMKTGEGRSETSKDDPPQNVKIPKCCKVPKKMKEGSIEKYEHPTEEEEIPIIYEFEIPPTPVYEEEVPRKFVSLLSVSKLNNEDADRVNFLQSLSDNLRAIAEQLDHTLKEAQRETTTLHSLREDFVRIIDQELNKNLPGIKANVDLVNNSLNVIQNDVKIIKNDLKNVLKQQKKQNEELKKNNETKELREEKKTDPNKVLDRVKSLEKRLCQCGKDVFKEKNKTVCKPATGCTCKYTNKTNNKDEDNTKDRKVCLTVQTCVLNTDNSMMVPYFMRFGNENDDFRYIPRLTYKIKKEHEEDSKNIENSVEQSPEE